MEPPATHLLEYSVSVSYIFSTLLFNYHIRVYITLHIKLEINKIRHTWKLVKYQLIIRLRTWNCMFRFKVEHKNTSILWNLLPLALFPTLQTSFCLLGGPYVFFGFLIETLSYAVLVDEGFSVYQKQFSKLKRPVLRVGKKVWNISVVYPCIASLFAMLTKKFYKV